MQKEAEACISHVLAYANIESPCSTCSYLHHFHLNSENVAPVLVVQIPIFVQVLTFGKEPTKKKRNGLCLLFVFRGARIKLQGSSCRAVVQRSTHGRSHQHFVCAGLV